MGQDSSAAAIKTETNVQLAAVSAKQAREAQHTRTIFVRHCLPCIFLSTSVHSCICDRVVHVNKTLARVNNMPPRTYLPTVLMTTVNGETVRALLDTGCELSLIFKARAQSLQGPREPAHETVAALGRAAVFQVTQSISLQVRTLQGWVYSLKLYIVDAPQLRLGPRNFEPYQLYPEAEAHFHGVPLADQYGGRQPPSARINAVIGQDLLWRIQSDMYVTNDLAVAFHNTIFGCTVQGLISPDAQPRAQAQRSQPFREAARGLKRQAMPALLQKQPNELEEPNEPQEQISDSEQRLIKQAAPQEPSVEEMLSQLWQLDIQSLKDEEKLRPRSVEQEKILDFFYKNITFRDGKYHIRLQVRDNAPALTDTRTKALRHFQFLERCLARDPELKKEYADTMAKYLKEGHIFRVPIEQLRDATPSTEYYAPHRCVRKTSSLITQKSALRIVFNFSSKGAGKGISLQDYLVEPAPPIINVVNVMLPFRLHHYAVVCDVKSMFYMVNVDKQHDSPFLRFFYRFPPGHEMATSADKAGANVFAFAVLPFGLRGSPAWANMVLNYHVDKYVSDSPEVVQLIKDSAFVDDVNWSHKDPLTCKQTIHEIHNILQSGGFSLAKYASNEPDLLRGLPQECLQFPDRKHGLTTVLGQAWDTLSDNLLFLRDPVEDFINLESVTKKSLLSMVSQLYDPCGYILPYIVTGKLLFHEVCMQQKEEMKELKGLAKRKALKASWTKNISAQIAAQAKAWIQQVADLQDMQIPRCLRLNKLVAESTVIAAGDASEKCVGAAVYLHTKYMDDTTSCNLVLSKQRLAATAATTLPRLELEAALLAAQAAREVIQLLKLPERNVILFSDSTIALCWLKADCPERYSVFVCNRIKKIQTLFCKSLWFHIEGTKNSSDLLTRPGISAKDLRDKYYEFWYHGGYSDSDPIRGCKPAEGADVVMSPDVTEEVKKRFLPAAGATLAATAIRCSQGEAKRKSDAVEAIFERLSDVNTILRVLALILRWRDKATTSALYKELQDGGYSLSERILTEDRQRALLCIYQHNQAKHFPQECRALAAGKQVSTSSNLAPLRPFLCNKVMRAKGRITSATLPHHIVNPIILQPRDNIIKALLRHWHVVNGHPSTNVFLYQLRQQGLWPLRPKNICREITRSCITCMKVHNKPATQAMADLPPERLAVTERPFLYVTFDALGPLAVSQEHNEEETAKAYVMIFTCMVYRAVELVLVPSLTTESIMSAIRKLIARYGPPKLLRCDRFKSHLQVKRELETMYSMLTHTAQGVTKQAERMGIEVQFSAPYASHTQGVVESLVKLTKECLYKALGRQLLTFPELDLAVIEAMSVVNRRPYSSAEISNADGTIDHVLSPFEMINGYKPSDFSATDTRHPVPENSQLADIWNRRCDLIRTFREKFISQYIHTLLPVPSKGKWLQETHDLLPNDLCLIKSTTKNKMTWPIYRVHEIKKGRDGLVRTVILVGHDAKLVTRPVSHVIKLVRPAPLVPQRDDSDQTT